MVKHDNNMPDISYDKELVDKLSKLYKVFGDKNRVGILYALRSDNMCVHELMKVLGAEQSLISHQLRVLRDANIVKTSRRGNEVVYSLADDHVDILLEVGIEHIEEALSEKNN